MGTEGLREEQESGREKKQGGTRIRTPEEGLQKRRQQGGTRTTPGRPQDDQPLRTRSGPTGRLAGPD